MNKKQRLQLDVELREKLYDAELRAEEVVIVPTDFSAKQIRDGVWQYLLDHSEFTVKGDLKIFFIVKSKENFWKRADARIAGIYKRTNALQIEEALTNRTFKLERRDNERRAVNHLVVCREIDSGHNLIKKAVLWLYRWSRNYLFEQHRENKDTQFVLGQKR